jgi:hypothetical protein
MNIFVFDPNPKLSAQYFFLTDPLRARKQVVELCQMMATLVNKPVHKKDGSAYKTPKSFRNHPATKWISVSQKNYAWCWEYLRELIMFTGVEGCKRAMFDLKPEIQKYDGVSFQWHTKKCDQPDPNIFESHRWYLRQKLGGKFKNIKKRKGVPQK